jgi:hypothetical protein
MATSPERGGDDERPPFFQTWNGVYALVLGTLAVVVALASIVSAIYR